MLSPELRSIVASRIGKDILREEPVRGGCIAHAIKLYTSGESYFLKWGTGIVAASFRCEAGGLQELANAKVSIRIPAVVDTDVLDDGTGFMILEWIDLAPPAGETWELFGRGLAAMHRVSGPYFGYTTDNFIGASPQRNEPNNQWPPFFRDRRLMEQVVMARRNGLWKGAWDPHLDRLCGLLDHMLPDTPEASLVHGDLWQGNMLADPSGYPVLVDPAVYFGHREADLAMTQLFGRPPAAFRRAYDNVWPLEKEFNERRDIYNLYHLINHLNLFGMTYAGSVGAIIKRF